jgi:REP element-mobilizing transposase RayT
MWRVITEVRGNFNCLFYNRRMGQPKFDPRIHHRQSIRLQGFDYSSAGAYFVTIVARGRECLFGEVVDGDVKLNRFGEIVQWEWLELPKRLQFVELGAFVVMPNHFHGILVIRDIVGATRQDLTMTRDSNALLHNVTTDGIDGSPLPDDTFDDGAGATRQDLSVTPDGNALLQTTTTDGTDGSPLPPRGSQPASLGAVIAQFKSRVTKRIWKTPSLRGKPIWQRNYHEHIIRNDREMERIWHYIESNPSNWIDDNENPSRVP